MRTKYKPWALPFLKEHCDIAYPTFKKDKFFDDTLEMEIGGGKGDFIISQAVKHPKVHFLMIERVISVAAPAVKKIIENDINNIRVIYDNFINVSHALKDNSVNKIYLNFSDPWPKKKHVKRRLTSPLFMNDYYRILKKDGLIVFKTDQKPLYEYTKLVLEKEKFTIILDNPHYNKLDKDDSLTEYEAKFRKEKKTIHRLILKKI
ncbi:MAG: tRNA (guanosine(46)-N7)-methyltransferase TrmB [Bacilli bacterium]|nr:tRNA (guanosine(46)-N7)-methyltransferase TrmB [Bacilli bacterium]